MRLRTHLAITSFFVLALLPFVSNKIIFITVAVFATYLPDIDTEHSRFGSKKIFRPLQIFMKHRGFFHSFTFLFLISALFILLIPFVALGFFVGYGFHLLSDSFTQEGISPFYPWKRKSTGKIRTGSHLENIVFAIFLIANLLLLSKYIFVN